MVLAPDLGSVQWGGDGDGKACRIEAECIQRISEVRATWPHVHRD
jgi:hypothetical protein